MILQERQPLHPPLHCSWTQIAPTALAHRSSVCPLAAISEPAPFRSPICRPPRSTRSGTYLARGLLLLPLPLHDLVHAQRCLSDRHACGFSIASVCSRASWASHCSRPTECGNVVAESHTQGMAADGKRSLHNRLFLRIRAQGFRAHPSPPLHENARANHGHQARTRPPIPRHVLHPQAPRCPSSLDPLSDPLPVSRVSTPFSREACTLKTSSAR